jgi:hypothetical protein
MLPDYGLFGIDSICNIFEDWTKLKIPSKRYGTEQKTPKNQKNLTFTMKLLLKKPF